jgi:hypothetical protein
MVAIRCAGYDNPKQREVLRDARPWLRACRDMNCPADRCLDMPVDEATD